MKTPSFALLAILLVTPALVFSQNSGANQHDRQSVQQQDSSTLTGCLSGNPDDYQVTDQSGTAHLIFNPGVDLSSYVGHSVEVTGLADPNRDASASSDEGTAHGMNFFKISQVTRDLGSCK